MSSSNFKFAFFGTDEFSVQFLEELRAGGFLPALVVTMPDKPKGRKMILTPPPVKVWAEANGIEFIQPISLKDLDSNSSFVIRNSSLSLVASYGKIIPQAVLDLPKHGTLNIHPSLLPKYRGATPLESAILEGDAETGVTIIKLDAEMDHGPIVAQTKISLAGWQPYYEELRDKLAELGAKLFIEKIDGYLAGEITPIEQDHSQATYTKKIEKTDGEIKPALNADASGKADDPELSYRKIRAFTPWPGTFFTIERNGQPLRIIIKKARLENGELKIDRVLPEGKNEISWAEFEANYLS